MQRIEVLAGPQGTLFGASSQAGVVRMITNKPVIGESSGKAEVESRVMPEGDTGAKVELVGNFPLEIQLQLELLLIEIQKVGTLIKWPEL